MQPDQQTSAPADPLATPTSTAGGGTPTAGLAAADAPPAAQPDPTAAGVDPTATDLAELRSLFAQQQEQMAALQRDLAARGPASNPSVTIASTAPAGGPAPAAAGTQQPPAHATLASLPDDIEPGAIVRFAGLTQANGADPVSGYAIVLDVIDVPDIDVQVVDMGNGQTSVRRTQLDTTHQEIVAAQLSVMGVTLRANNIVDEDTSARVQAQLDRAG